MLGQSLRCFLYFDRQGRDRVTCTGMSAGESDSLIRNVCCNRPGAARSSLGYLDKV